MTSYNMALGMNRFAIYKIFTIYGCVCSLKEQKKYRKYLSYFSSLYMTINKVVTRLNLLTKLFGYHVVVYQAFWQYYYCISYHKPQGITKQNASFQIIFIVTLRVQSRLGYQLLAQPPNARNKFGRTWKQTYPTVFAFDFGFHGNEYQIKGLKTAKILW